MPNENLNKYVAALTEKDNSSSNKDEGFIIYLSDSSRKMLQELKKTMEWNNEIALNSALTIFFKYGLNDKKNLKLSESKITILDKNFNDKKKLEFHATLKNEDRIKELVEEDSVNDIFSSIAKSGIEILYKRLIRSDKDE